MKKTTKKLFATFIAGVSLFSAVGCNTKVEEMPDEPGVLNILCMEAGYGTEFMDEWIKAFKAKPGNENIEINVRYDVQAGEVTSSFLLDPSRYPYDLLFTGGFQFRKYAENGTLEPLTDVVAQFENPILSDYKEMGSVNGVPYVLSWCHGPSGLIYNTDMLPEDKVPKTTNELISLCNDIVAGKISTVPTDVKPFVWAGSNASVYWRYSADAWWAQYEGAQSYRDFWTFTVDGIADSIDGYTVYGQKGILEGYSVLEDILTPTNSIYGSEAKDHTTAQSDFMLGRSVMIPCGDWIESEMKDNYASVTSYKMMKNPIISALGVKLKLAGNSATNEEHEAKLSQIVGLVDAGKTASEIAIESGVTESKAQAVIDARMITHTISNRHQVFLPASSNAKEEAKKFLVFMASDEAGVIFQKEAHSQLPFEYDDDFVGYTGASEYLKNNIKISKNAKFIYADYDTSSLRYKGGINDQFMKVKDVEIQLYSGAITAEKFWDSNYKYFTSDGDNMWNYHYNLR